MVVKADDTANRRERAQAAQDTMLALLREHDGACEVNLLVDQTNAALPARWRLEDGVDYGAGTIFMLEELGQIKVGGDAIIRLP
jgi:hypothetical protein